MDVPSELLTSDLDRLFADWGEACELRVIEATYDAGTQRIDESLTSQTSLVALVGTEQQRIANRTAGQATRGERTFAIRTADLPATSPGPTWRVVLGETVWEVLGSRRAAEGYLTVLTTRQRSEVEGESS